MKTATKHRYTAQQEEWLVKHWDKKSMVEIVAYMGVPEKALKRKMQRLRAADKSVPRRRDAVPEGGERQRMFRGVMRTFVKTDGEWRLKTDELRRKGIRVKMFTEQKFNPTQLANMRVYKARSLEDKTAGKVKMVIPELKNMEVWYDPALKTPEEVRARYLGRAAEVRDGFKVGAWK